MIGREIERGREIRGKTDISFYIERYKERQIYIYRDRGKYGRPLTYKNRPC